MEKLLEAENTKHLQQEHLRSSERAEHTYPPDSPSYMFTEEQIGKQLVDMKEQTEFMKKFRSALGIALEEIKTLRTTLSVENAKNVGGKNASVCSTKRESTFAPSATHCSSPNGAESEACKRELPESGNTHRCVCSQFDSIDLVLLQEVLSKMSISDVKNGLPSAKGDKLRGNRRMQGKQTKNGVKIDVEKLQQASEAFTKFILRVEGLKSLVADRNASVMRLCKELTESRLIRVKRETKLEQKLNEVQEWKGKYENVKKLKEKQIKITRGLRVALNAERQKVKSSEKMQNSLEETRNAFESLKSQAGQLMHTLNEKDAEIAELNAKLDEIQRKDGAYLHIQQQQAGAQNHGTDSAEREQQAPAQCTDDASTQTDIPCNTCIKLRDELDALKRDWPQQRHYGEMRQGGGPPLHSATPADDLAHRRNQNRPDGGARERPPHYPHRGMYGAPHGHPYTHGRTRVYAPYTSPESYRRVSRPPLRRRLHYETSSSHAPVISGGHGPPQPQPINPMPPVVEPDTVLLSPIDETDESSNDDANMRNQSTITKTTAIYDDIEGGLEAVHPQVAIVSMSEAGAQHSTYENRAVTLSPNREGSRGAHEKSWPTHGEYQQDTASPRSQASPTMQSGSHIMHPPYVKKDNAMATESNHQSSPQFHESHIHHEQPHAFDVLHGSIPPPVHHQPQHSTPRSQHDDRTALLSDDKAGLQASVMPPGRYEMQHGNPTDSPIKTGSRRTESPRTYEMQQTTASSKDTTGSARSEATGTYQMQQMSGNSQDTTGSDQFVSPGTCQMQQMTTNSRDTTESARLVPPGTYHMQHQMTNSEVTSGLGRFDPPCTHGMQHQKVSSSPAKTASNLFEPSKASYLEVGTSSTPSPSDSRNSSVDLLDDLTDNIDPHLTFNSIIRPSPADSPGMRLEQRSRSSAGSSPIVSFSQEVYDAPHSPEPQAFGVIWHPALMKQHHVPANDSLDDASSLSDQSSERSFGHEPRSKPHSSHLAHNHASTSPHVTSRRPKRSHRESRHVMYKGHQIDVTRFSIHAFRDIVWTLGGGPESADDFIKFLASLSRKLNSSPKWAGRHAMGDPKDWLALRGLF